jgi:hypothetical protein
VNLSTLTINGETVAIITLYGDNRHQGVTEWHRKVMVDHFGLPVNYIKCPFPGVSHGAMMNEVLRQTIDLPNRPTYYWWLDNDAIILQRRAFDIMLGTVSNKVTLWGQAWNSSHKVGPLGTNQHPYASQACLCFASDLYDALGRPDCDHHNSRSDTAEELTWRAEELGYTVALQYPSWAETRTTTLSQSCSYGRGNIYGPNLSYHESRADLDGHVERFVNRCQQAIAGAFG